MWNELTTLWNDLTWKDLPLERNDRIPLKRMKESEGNTCMLLRCAIGTETIDRAMVPKTRKRTTQNSNTEHPKLENKASKTRKRSIQNSKPVYAEGQQL